ncbi:hypothetical protein HPB51_002671 [Rhipicephalus microplus]|uniref:Uncharacterized protein n=1 Tax=Rhipicephalus microplus TaxID=6941 RepID=A0A9J6EQF3_RHIMP|nr:hypothetical protein HPB51_002671 [Rhipicephalus microplus]
MQKPLMCKNLDIHLLCQNESDLQRKLYIESPVKVLSWCLNWNDYHTVLSLACLHQKQVMVAASDEKWHHMTLGVSQLSKDCNPLVTRISIEGEHAAQRSLQMLLAQMLGSLPLTNNKDRQQVKENVDDRHSTHWRLWTRFSGRMISVGCIALQDKSAFQECMSPYNNTLAQALSALNCTLSMTPVGRGMFASALKNGEIDILYHSIGLTPDRYQHFHFAVNRFGQAVYCVKKRWKHQAAFLHGVFPWLFLLALYIVASASCFVLLNIYRGNQPLKGLSEVVFALIATTLSLSAPIHPEHARSRSGRVIMACWMLACFSLTAYTKSFLTASLMSKRVWEADDSLDKMLPKLQYGRLLPCTANNSFINVLLSRADGSGGDVIDFMAMATRRWGHKQADISGSREACLERASRGTHVFLTETFEICKKARFEDRLAIGERPVLSLIAGFPIKKNHPLSSELRTVVNRISETGWNEHIRRTTQRNITNISSDEEASMHLETLVALYLYFCVLGLICLLLECACSRVIRRVARMSS